MAICEIELDDKMLETLIHMIKVAVLSESIDYYQIEEYILIKKHLEKEQLRNIEKRRK
ncbi:hypothetical protein J6W34_05155 [bacterium]|nr:hypothetical protein [bacterium]